MGPFIGNITLPVPNNLVNRSSSNYDNVSLQQFGQVKADAAGAVSDKYNGKMSESDLVSAMENSGKDVVRGAVLKAMDTFGLADPISLGTGLARNPHLAALYRGENFRTHAFSWKFSPLNESESIVLNDIIKMLKKAKAPDYSETMGNSMFKFPNEFNIQFTYPEYLYKFRPAVLIDIVVDYHASGRPSYFNETVAPVVVDITLFFAETSIVTAAMIDEGY
jgi:hypothetical protein